MYIWYLHQLLHIKVQSCVHTNKKRSKKVIQFSCQHASADRRQQRKRTTTAMTFFTSSILCYIVLSLMGVSYECSLRQTPSTQVSMRMRVVVISGSHYKEYRAHFSRKVCMGKKMCWKNMYAHIIQWEAHTQTSWRTRSERSHVPRACYIAISQLSHLISISFSMHVCFQRNVKHLRWQRNLCLANVQRYSSASDPEQRTGW